jgi:GGDEF domain-containing protein
MTALNLFTGIEPGREFPRVRIAGIDRFLNSEPGSRVATFVTVNIGVAAGSTGPQKHYEHLQGRADDAIYAAKRAGRDRVMVFTLETQIVPDTLSAVV